MNEVIKSTLAAYEQGRIDTNERLAEVPKRGIRETNTREDLINFMVKELEMPSPRIKGECDCD